MEPTVYVLAALLGTLAGGLVSLVVSARNARRERRARYGEAIAWLARHADGTDFARSGDEIAADFGPDASGIVLPDYGRMPEAQEGEGSQASSIR